MVTAGVVSAGAEQNGVRYLLLDSATARGSSGSPVVNLDGEVVAMLDSGLGPFSYAVDLTTDRDLTAP